VLEVSYVLYLLPPHHANFNKRLVKAPKLYFYDTGLACSLLSIREAPQVSSRAEVTVVCQTARHSELAEESRSRQQAARMNRARFLSKLGM